MTSIHTIARQLTHWHQHREPYTFEGGMSTWDTHHTTQVPPLLVQLDESDPANTGAAFRATPGSRPPTSLDALDTLAHIDNEAATWVRKLGHDDPGTTIACVRKVYSLAPSAEFCGRDSAVIEDVARKVKIEGKWETRKRKEATCCATHKIERDMRRWWTQARIVSGWDSPAWAPNNTCPHCDDRRSLRIRVEDKSALCTNCRTTWDQTNIGLLAEHIRNENDDTVIVEAS